MKITIERKYKKKDYTIGNLYLNDSKPLCNTLEPADRGLHIDYSKADRDIEWMNVQTQAVRIKKAHRHGTTAIPTGTYSMVLSASSKFRGLRPYLAMVPGFIGIMIHEGNTPKDTKGCILVGENTKPGMVLSSRKYVQIIIDAMHDAYRKGEEVMITIR